MKIDLEIFRAYPGAIGTVLNVSGLSYCYITYPFQGNYRCIYTRLNPNMTNPHLLTVLLADDVPAASHPGPHV